MLSHSSYLKTYSMTYTDPRRADTANSPVKTLSRLSGRSRSTSSTSSLTGYSPVEKIPWVRPAPCKHTGTCFAWCERRRRALWKSIRSSRARCTVREHLLTSAFANKQQVRQRLAIKHGLRTEKKKKPIMRAEDDFELLKTPPR